MNGISSSLSGMNDAQSRMAKAASNIASASVDGSNVDLTKEIVDSKIAATLHKANAATLKAQLENEKTVIDILA